MKKMLYFDIFELIISIIFMLIFSVLIALVITPPTKYIFLICDIYVTLNIANMWENIEAYYKTKKINNNE